MITLSTYLIFNGNCEEAFLFYEKVFGGEILFMGRYKDVPADSRKAFAGAGDEQIMHVSLQLSPSVMLMGNDTVQVGGDETGAAVTNNFFLYVTIDDRVSAYRIFDELSAGGKVVMQMAPTFWANHYGIVTDKFGIRWKITYEEPGQ